MKVNASLNTINHVRCRYCTEADGFLSMVAHLDGRYICNRCGHIEIPNVEFECDCGNCAAIRRFELSRATRPT